MSLLPVGSLKILWNCHLCIRPVVVQLLNSVRLSATPWSIAPLSILWWFILWCVRHLIKHILGVSVMVFLDEVNVWISRLGKADCLPRYEWASSNQLKNWIEQESRVRGTFSCLTLYMEYWSFLALKLSWRWLFMGFEPASFQTGCPGSPVYPLQMWGFLSLHNQMNPSFIINTLAYVLAVFSGEPLYIHCIYMYKEKTIIMIV